MARKYANPPVVEAVCEFRFTPDTPWDLTIPGLVYDKVKADFPNREQRVIREITLATTPEGTRRDARTHEVVVLLADEKKSFLQVGPRVLAINRLAPYRSWKEFLPQIEAAYRALADTVQIQGIQRIGLLYINRMEIPGSSVDLDEYFMFRPFLGKELPQNMDNFLLTCLLPFRERKDFCRIELVRAVPEKEGAIAFLLTLDYYCAPSEAEANSAPLKWIEDAHSTVEDLFEGCINDGLRKSFGEVG